MSKNKGKITTETFISIISVVVIFVLWYAASANEWVNPKLIPSPQKVWDAFVTTMTDGYKGNTLIEHFAESMIRMFKSFGLAFITAAPLGLASGFSSKIRAALDPIIEFYRPLPPLAYYTLLVLAFGIGDESKIALLYLACFAPIYISCVAAVGKITPDYINSAYTVGANRLQVFTHVIFPSCLPDIFVGLRTAIGVAYTTLVAAEMVAANSGIGWMVLDAKNWFRNDIIFVGIIVMGITGILIDAVLRFIEKKVVPWSGKA